MQTIEAIYQNGMFKPLKPVSETISEGETVEITIKEKKLSPEEMLELASRVYEGLSDEDISEIEKIALDRSNFFGDRKLGVFRRRLWLIPTRFRFISRNVRKSLPKRRIICGSIKFLHFQSFHALKFCAE